MTLKFEVYRARRGLLLRTQWRWRLRARNGCIIATGGEGYANRSDAKSAIEIIRTSAITAPIHFDDAQFPHV